MAKNDPKFVRLPVRDEGGCLAEVNMGTGWFIGGKDIKPFPEDTDPLLQRFVRDQVRAGRLEEASAAEHDIVTDATKSMRQMHVNQLDEHEAHDRAGHQEGQMAQLSRATQTALDQARAKAASDDDDEEVDVSGSDDPLNVSKPAHRRSGKSL